LVYESRYGFYIEAMPLEKAPEAYAKMMSGKARIRMVLTMQS
jgi:D-arabinose 1-dehydrogenase-like Zn-dependent alcohol dehydrogenase